MIFMTLWNQELLLIRDSRTSSKSCTVKVIHLDLAKISIPLKDMTPFYESWTKGTKDWRRFRKNATVQPPPDTLIKIVDENNVTSEIPFRETEFYIERKKDKVDTSKLKEEL